MEQPIHYLIRLRFVLLLKLKVKRHALVVHTTAAIMFIHLFNCLSCLWKEICETIVDSIAEQPLHTSSPFSNHSSNILKVNVMETNVKQLPLKAMNTLRIGELESVLMRLFISSNKVCNTAYVL